MSLFDWLLGRNPAPQVIPAEPLKAYPTPEDARAARAAGYGYGTPLDNPGMRVFGDWMAGPRGNRVFEPGLPDRISNQVITTQQPQVSKSGPGVDSRIGQAFDERMMQAALAANYLPVAALGLDPNVVNYNATPERLTVGGMYSPDRDQIFVNRGLNDDADDRSTVLHEAIHRGIKKVMNSGLAHEGKVVNVSPAHEETFVRQLMRDFAGNPETGKVAEREKSKYGGKAYTKDELETLNAIVAEMFRRQRPFGGPR